MGVWGVEVGGFDLAKLELPKDNANAERVDLDGALDRRTLSALLPATLCIQGLETAKKNWGAVGWWFDVPIHLHESGLLGVGLVIHGSLGFLALASNARNGLGRGPGSGGRRDQRRVARMQRV